MVTVLAHPDWDYRDANFVAATGGVAALTGLAGCMSQGPTGLRAGGFVRGSANSSGSDLPWTSSPEVVQVDEQGSSVTLRSVTSRHAVHPMDSMGGPVELPKVWAFQADDGTPSVPGPILRTTEGNDIEVTLDNTDASMPPRCTSTARSWRGKTTAFRRRRALRLPAVKHTYTIPANVPGTHLSLPLPNTPAH